MAIVSTANRTCPSEDLLQLYHTWYYLAINCMNCLIPLGSVYLLPKASYNLCSQSIIQHSTRVLLITSMFFATLHQVAYGVAKAKFVYTILFKISEPCMLQITSNDCKYISIAQTTGTCGMAFTPVVMSIDRALNLLFPKTFHKFKSKPGIVFAIISFIASFSMWFLLTMHDPLTGYVSHCGFYPAGSSGNFQAMVTVIMGLSIFNMLFDLVLWKIAQLEIKARENYEFKSRYNARISLKCITAVFAVSVFECVANMSASGLLSLLMFVSKSMTTSTYFLLLSVVYTQPYALLILPILISYLLIYIRDQTTIGILNLTTQRETMDEHFARLKQAW